MSNFGLTMAEEIINRVDKSGLVQINLDEFYPQGDRMRFDIAEFLHEGLILIEKDFRDKVKNTNWQQFEAKYIAVVCSADAIVPLWAFMLVVSQLKPYAKHVVMGDQQDLEKAIFTQLLNEHDFAQYQDKNIIVKGCGNHPIPESVFVDFTYRLQNVAKNIMFGEACSAVPLFKRK